MAWNLIRGRHLHRKRSLTRQDLEILREAVFLFQGDRQKLKRALRTGRIGLLAVLMQAKRRGVSFPEMPERSGTLRISEQS